MLPCECSFVVTFISLPHFLNLSQMLLSLVVLPMLSTRILPSKVIAAMWYCLLMSFARLFQRIIHRQSSPNCRQFNFYFSDCV